jgi:HEAT repeat protein
MVVETHVRDILRCRNVDVSALEEFLGEEHPHEVRWAAARILAVKGRIKEVVKAALLSEEREDILNFISILGKQNAGLEELESLLSSEDTMVRDAAVDMFRRAGNSDVLFPLIFDRDDVVVQRIKRYINEAGQCRQTRSS